MGVAERRAEIIRILCRKRRVTIASLAKELNVSTRTILRDIVVLSITEPIYTQCGRYGGGVYIIDGYHMNRMFMTDEELTLLHKLLSFGKGKKQCDLKDNEIKLLEKIISQYTRKNEREIVSEKERKRII